VEAVPPPFRKYVFVCENTRAEGDCCGEAGSRIREALKRAAKDKGLAKSVRVSRSGCLDTCMEGPNVLLLPDGVWFRRVREEDVDAILAKAAEGL
jgi:sirohydrochlorin cobaltochelatase